MRYRILSSIRDFACVLVVSIALLGCNKTTLTDSPGKENPSDSSWKRFIALDASQTGITYKSDYQPNPNDPTGLLSGGASVAAGDINNDGLTDLLFAGGLTNSRLYLNRGDIRFEDITEASGVLDSGPEQPLTEGVNLVDVNGDGWLDIFVSKSGLRGNFRSMEFSEYGNNLLFINEGKLTANGIPTFTESAEEYGLDLIGLTVSAHFFDYDNDGDLDVYMIHTPDPGPAFNFSYYRNAPASRWLNDQFLENIDGQKFVDVREKAGILNEKNIGLSVSVTDLDQDGWLDIYVANDFLGRDFFYHNQGNKTFKESHKDFFSKTSLSSMGTDFADINNDGWEDLFVGEMMPSTHERQKVNLVPFSIEMYNQLSEREIPQYTRNTLHLNQQGKRMRDVGLLMGVHATEWSWSSIFFDADNDGWKDLFIPNGIKKDMTNMDFVNNNFGGTYEDMANPSAQATANITQAPPVTTPNFIYRNLPNSGFQLKNSDWGINSVVKTRGATYADLDNDGDIELILNHMESAPVIYKNLTQENDPQHYLKVKLVGPELNTQGLGHRISVFYNGNQQHQDLTNQIGYQATPEPIAHFGLGENTRVDSLVVHWLGGEKYVKYDIGIDQFIEIQYDKVESTKANSFTNASTLLTSTTGNGINYIHREKKTNDFKRERLLYREYSKEGPGIAVSDVNGDGLDDIFIGGASGQNGSIFLQTENNRFVSSNSQPWEKYPEQEHMGLIFFDANNDSSPDLYLSSGSYEFATNDPALQDQLYINDGKGSFTLSKEAIPEFLSSSSTVNAADVDLDGDLDLFVGSRVVPGNYGKIPQSYLLLNDNGVFAVAEEEVMPGLTELGRVSSAIWSDYDNDQDMDLIVVGEWLPIMIYTNNGGKFSVQTIEGTNGWWNSIQGGDLDQDGDIDYVLGNHGQNSIFTASPQDPVTLLSNDFDGNGTIDPVIFKYTDNINGPFVNRDAFISQLPSYKQQFTTFEKYAQATIDNIFEPDLYQDAEKSYVYELRTSWLENKGDAGFELHALPFQAQEAPVYGIQIIDINTDSYPDIVLCGNSFSFHYEYGPIDALQGVVLVGNQDGTFKALSPVKSGLDVAGDAKSLAMIHLGRDTNSLIVTQNDDPLKTFEFSNPLTYIPAKANEIAALIEYKDGRIQRTELYRGSGYLSQSSYGVWVGDEVLVVKVLDVKGNERVVNVN